MALGRGRARRPMLQRRRLTRTTHLPEIERRTGRWRVGPQCLNERRRCITPRRVPPLELLSHMGSATTAPARSTNYVVNHMCEHICEPIHSTGRILPGEPSITMCGENTAYNLSTHTAGALYEAFPPCEARRVLERLEFHYVPKHASWLNMVEIEIGVLRGQCLD